MNIRTNDTTCRAARETGGIALRQLLAGIALACVLPSAAHGACGPTDTGPCDDGRACTTSDHCAGGSCVGTLPAVPATCDWAIVHGSGSHDTRARAGNDTEIFGSICGQEINLERGANIEGDVVATAGIDRAVRASSAATVGGSIVTAADDSGPDPLVSDCQAAIASVGPTITTLDSVAFRSSRFEGDTRVAGHGNLTLTATGPLNVIDFAGLVLNDWATLTLDGNGIPNATFVLRVNRRIYFHFQSSIVLAGGAAPERVILYGREECRFGQNVTGAGTVFCPYDSLKMDHTTRWTGALVGGGDRIDLRHHVELIHVPSEIPAP